MSRVRWSWWRPALKHTHVWEWAGEPYHEDWMQEERLFGMKVSIEPVIRTFRRVRCACGVMQLRELL